ncbi:enoyl-CoA hydratase/isomerase family protein [Planctomycetota bacterium]
MTEDSTPPILTNVEGGTGFITLNRADRLNAFSLRLGEQFLAALRAFHEDDAVRAVVVRGVGRLFSVGGDVKEMLEGVEDGQDRAAYFRAPLTVFHEVVVALRQMPKPVIAAVHGAVAGVAFNVMLACDLKVAAEGTRFTQAFVKLGLSPDGGGTYFLPRLVGYARACELAMLPGEIDVRTALSWGLVNWVVPADRLDAKVREIADRLAAGPTAALARAKRLLNGAYTGSLREQLDAERLAQIENAASRDFDEGLRAFVEKREPRFAGR